MDVLMPQLGETVAEGKITKWFKTAGDKVAPGDNLFEIETDKVSMEVPATEPGVLTEVRVAAGEIAPVGAVVAVISASGAAVKPAPAKPATPPHARRRRPRRPPRPHLLRRRTVRSRSIRSTKSGPRSATTAPRSSPAASP